MLEIRVVRCLIDLQHLITLWVPKKQKKSLIDSPIIVWMSEMWIWTDSSLSQLTDESSIKLKSWGRWIRPRNYWTFFQILAHCDPLLLILPPPPLKQWLHEKVMDPIVSPFIGRKGSPPGTVQGQSGRQQQWRRQQGLLLLPGSGGSSFGMTKRMLQESSSSFVEMPLTCQKRLVKVGEVGHLTSSSSISNSTQNSTHTRRR